MVIFRYYDKEKRVDHVWYDSSNVLYSECDDLVDSFKTVRVTFKNGDTYQYKDVDVNDYVMFETGGADASNGKAFYKYIRKYDFVKLDRIPPEKIAEMLEEYKKIKAGQTSEENAGEKAHDDDPEKSVPDKIYTNSSNGEAFEYIRKDLLLEWAEGKMTVEGATDGIVGGYDFAMKELVEYLKSL